MITSKRGLGMLAALALIFGLLVGPPKLAAQDDPPPAGATAAELAGDDSAGTVTFSGDGSPVRTAAGNSDIEFVALGTGCRFFDTRNALGSLQSGVGRDYSLRDANIPGQGGNPGGCGIPSSAVAVDVSLSTVANTPSGTGFARIGKGGTSPTATVLQFLQNQGTSVTTTSPLDSSDRVRLQTSGGSAGMTGDVLGYWEDTLHATVNSSGALNRGSGVVSVQKLGTTGFFIVTFDRDVSTCTPVASAYTSAATFVGATLNGPAGEVFVRTYNSAAAGAFVDFRLVMEC